MIETKNIILMPSIICHQYPDLIIIYIVAYIYGLYIVLKKMNKNLQEPDWSFFLF